MARSGADTTAIQKILGHTDSSIAATVYTHIDIDSLQKAIEFFNKKFVLVSKISKDFR